MADKRRSRALKISDLSADSFSPVEWAFSGVDDFEALTAFLGEVLEWEAHIQAGTLPEAQVPAIYEATAAWPIEADNFLRHNLVAFLSQLLPEFAPWATTLHAACRRGQLHDPGGYDQLVETVAEAGVRFSAQARNAFGPLAAAAGASSDEARLRGALSSYPDLYESELPLWMVGVASDVLKNGRFRPHLLGGPGSATSQGSIVEQVVNLASNGPFAAVVDAAYDPELRNVVQHNDYSVRRQGALEVVSLSDDSVWGEEDVLTTVQTVHGLLQSAHLACQLILADRDARSAPLEDCGIVSLTYSLVGTDEPPMVYMPQLWCFYELDTAGSWLDGTVARLRELPDGRDEVLSSENCKISGERLPDAFRSALSHGWLRVLRAPVTPSFGWTPRGFAASERLLVEVSGRPVEHLVPIAWEPVDQGEIKVP